ncbi:protein NO VEIN domain-containing protein [Actinoplanes sp. NPDC000266]
MAVNFQLSRARELPAGDPLGRSWVGWRETSTDDELWELNRGRWALADRVDRERFATLSFDGRVQVVAEISGRNRCDDGDKIRWRLSGTVLRPGDPVYDALKGRPVPRHRNPVGYFDTSDLDAMPAAERAGFERRVPATMVVTWNPEKWNPGGTWADQTYPQDVQAVAAGGLLRGQWATGGRTSGIEPGDRVFFLRQGKEPRGVIGSGTTASRIFSDEHWDDDRADQNANYVLIDWDTLLLPEDGLPHEVLAEHIPEGGRWRPQASGWILPPDVAAKLEVLWAEHLGRTAPPSRTTPRQGWQMDPVRRKKVEDAAQKMLEEHFRKAGWTVEDVRYGNPYDAVAIKDGRTIWLEAKGTETTGASVIVTRNEVEWARTHPGDCKLGILSDVTFLPNGEVDTTGATFHVLDFSPGEGSLTPRAYDFTPAAG